MRLISDLTLHYISKPFRYIERFFLIAYVIFYIGLISYEPAYIGLLSKIFQVVISLFLMYKFNPFREHTLDVNDGKIIFASAVFMLTNVVVVGSYKDIIIK
jgi:hypothetical protein